MRPAFKEPAGGSHNAMSSHGLDKAALLLVVVLLLLVLGAGGGMPSVGTAGPKYHQISEWEEQGGLGVEEVHWQIRRGDCDVLQ